MKFDNNKAKQIHCNKTICHSVREGDIYICIYAFLAHIKLISERVYRIHFPQNACNAFFPA